MESSLLVQLLPFVVLVLIHHFLLAPLLQRKRIGYYLLTAVLLGLFGCWCFLASPRPERRMGPPPGDTEARRGPIRPEVMDFTLGIFLVIGDLGLAASARMKKDERQLQELKAENLNQQLESLRYQINPHFFMNTLNNIQSLVLTDPDKATEMISEFSKIMRIVLYEGNAPTIPLSRETEYLKHYLSLMRMRYPASVEIDYTLPEETGDAVVPPLLMASFVENAFKHGISYEKPSYVRVVLETTRSRILFHCTNSSHSDPQDGQHGLGLDNVRKRLTLLYDADYALRIRQQDGVYDVLLDIPAQSRKAV